MRMKDVEVGTKVITPAGKTGTVKASRVVLTEAKGRPATVFKVGGEEYRAKDLRPAA